MQAQGMSPLQLDMLINGLKVFIYRRPSDQVVYAELCDFSRFGVDALEVVRIPLDKLTPTTKREDVLGDPIVLKAIARHQ